MEELSFSCVQSFGKSGQLGKTNRDAVIRVSDEDGKDIETHEHAGDFKEP